MQKVTCIIPTSFTKAATKNLLICCQSILENKDDRFDFKIFIVTENKKAYEKMSYEKIILVSKNSGFAGMNNFVLENEVIKNDADYFLLINDDAKIHKDFFKNLNNKADIVVPLVLSEGGKIVDSFGVEYFTSGYAKNSLSKKNKTSLFSASCILIKREFLAIFRQRYGYFFNSKLFYYLEDVEFAIRCNLLRAKIGKNNKMIAMHRGSFTSGKKSYFTMFQTYRNILWVIILTWPKASIVKNIPNIFLVQAWVFVYSFMVFGPKLYFQVLFETLLNMKKLVKTRRRNLNNYPKKHNFEKIFSQYSFRTYHDIKIPTIKI